ncbi:MAG TPA: hypothetical protein VFQ42_02145 [Mycobacterium sp.]|nr:hypothetical protein [Mycobacterium sp.]
MGPRRVAAQLALPMWGGQPISATGVLKGLRRHGLQTRRRRLALVAGYAAPPEPQPRLPPVPLHLEAEKPGDLVQLDCIHIGRLTGTKGRVWQYTAIDVASPFVWAEVHVTPLNPAVRFTTGPGGPRPGGRRLEAPGGLDRQRLRIPRGALQSGRGSP